MALPASFVLRKPTEIRHAHDRHGTSLIVNGTPTAVDAVTSGIGVGVEKVRGLNAVRGDREPHWRLKMAWEYDTAGWAELQGRVARSDDVTLAATVTGPRIDRFSITTWYTAPLIAEGQVSWYQITEGLFQLPEGTTARAAVPLCRLALGSRGHLIVLGEEDLAAAADQGNPVQIDTSRNRMVVSFPYGFAHAIPQLRGPTTSGYGVIATEFHLGPVTSPAMRQCPGFGDRAGDKNAGFEHALLRRDYRRSPAFDGCGRLVPEARVMQLCPGDVTAAGEHIAARILVCVEPSRMGLTPRTL